MHATVEVSWTKGGEAVKTLQYDSFRLSVNQSGDDAPFIFYNTGKADGTKRYTDGKAELIWKFDVDKFEGLVVAAQINQNYILEVSGDGVEWIEVINYAKISSYTASGTNDGVACVIVGAYDEIGEILYLRLRSSMPTTGWGGAIKSLTFQYLVEDGKSLSKEDLK
jgi:hypothetical protein